eukprot:8301977-Alexandrium_andersonii.AAC.1
MKEKVRALQAQELATARLDSLPPGQPLAARRQAWRGRAAEQAARVSPSRRPCCETRRTPHEGRPMAGRPASARSRALNVWARSRVAI